LPKSGLNFEISTRWWTFPPTAYPLHVGVGFVPGILVQLVALVLIWAYLHHLIAGVRHLYMDAHHAVSKEFGKSSAVVTLVLSLGLTAALGAKLFGLY